MPSASKPLAFISYSWADNEDGFVEKFSKNLEAELRVQLGESVNLFLDRKGIRAGEAWQPILQTALEQSEYLIPIVTPSYLRSDNGRAELESFLKRDEVRPGSIFPIHYVEALPGQSEDPLAQELARRQWVDWRKLRFEPWESPQVRRSIELLAQSIRSAIESRKPENSSAAEGLVVERLRLENFRCFKELDLHLGVTPPFRQESTLDGNWTCVAGINGAGKSSILQAICIALLGPLASELGGGLLGRMRRVGMSPTERTVISLDARRGDRTYLFPLQIDDKGIVKTGSDPFVERSIAVAYGATRNLGDDADSPFKSLSRPVQAMIGMFRPLAQLSSAEVLLSDRRRSPHLLPLFTRLLREIFEEDLIVSLQADSPSLRFMVSGKDRVEAVDLPDGFRSSAAWLADLCATWCDRSPQAAATGDPNAMEAMVMIDEIDLHLHPAMQRQLVPRLRKALPKVQWIVTTHSPLVLANFDANEIVALDRDQEGHIRRLDRQILSFSSDQIYDWLMGTRPTGAAMDQLLEEAGRGAGTEAVAELIRTTPETSPEAARQQVSEFREILKSLKR